MGKRRYIQEILLFVAAVALALAIVQQDAPDVLMTALREFPTYYIN